MLPFRPHPRLEELKTPFLQMPVFPEMLTTLALREFEQPGDREAFHRVKILEQEVESLQKELKESRDLFHHFVSTSEAWAKKRKREEKEKKGDPTILTRGMNDPNITPILLAMWKQHPEQFKDGNYCEFLSNDSILYARYKSTNHSTFHYCYL
jgi:hypothetical protein